MNLSQTDSNNNNNTDQLIERKAIQLVRLALFTEHKKIPIKKDEISKKVLGDMNRSFQKVFDRAQQILKEVCGLQLVELPQKDTVASTSIVSRRNATNTKEKSYTKSYILQSIIPIEILQHPLLPPLNYPNPDHLGLSMIILTLVLVSDHYIQHASLVQFLRTFNVDEEKQLKPCLNQMIRQNYLVRFNTNQTGNLLSSMSGDRDQVTYEYRWGPRAKVEISFDKLISFLKQIYGDNYSDDIESEIKRTLEEMIPNSNDSNTENNPSASQN